ncbi:T9SS type A sorting domain-containing protein [Candidatus Marinimicrobia bacterium]|nr:T9SS type A sorting domain-containing protein [Candidatus Neomarinimicrobiota bacterium]
MKIIKIFLFFYSISIFASTINIANTGSDESGDGTFENPFLTIQKGVDVALGMDTVFVSNGIYEGGIIIYNKAISLIGESRDETKINQPISLPQISIFDSQDDTVRVENFRIKRGNSERGGGLSIARSSVVINNVELSNNNSSNNGGAINAINSTMKVHNSLFFLNSSDSLGGSIYSKETFLELDGLELRNNSSLAGGAVGLDTLSKCIINNSQIFNNGANVGGGIAVFNGGKLTILNSDIYGNNAAGGLIPQHSDPDNFPLYGGGGGLYQQFSDSLVILNSNFEDNTTLPGIGGGLAIYYSSDIVLENVNINGNESGGAGGGICFLRSDNINYTSGMIRDNRSNSNSGGGIMMGTETFDASIIINATFNRLNFINNYAHVGGGGLMLWSAEVNVYNSTFSQNEANDNNGVDNWSGGGLSSHSMAEPNIINSIFYDNYPNSLYHPSTTSSMSVKYSLLEEFHTGVENLVEIDPLFNDPENGDFTLQPNSPCIDAGISDFDDDGVNEVTDFLGSAPDLGSTEYMVGPPLGFNSIVVDSAVILTWLQVTDLNLEFYKLERATDSLFSENVIERFIPENFYTDEEIDWDIEYFYRVSAYLGYWTDHSETESIILEWLNLTDKELVPGTYIVSQNYPNPFNPSTTLRYSMSKGELVNIAVYDMSGRLVKDLLNGYQNAGYNSIQWNATNNQGQSVSAGMYICIIKIGSYNTSKKMLLLK